MNITRTAGMVSAAIVALALTGPAYAQANNGCANATLHGIYAFHITGQILAPAAVAGPVSGVALTTFDGLGNLTQIDNIVHNGVVPVEDWRPASGSYSVNSDCTGTFTFTPMPTNSADAGPALKVHFVLTNSGAEILTVVTGSPNTPPFVASIVSTGNRLTLAAPGVIIQ
ncbi:MAG: hypothetical protein ABSG03_05520 [Bryobacteraceae bacterium]|jgi:hypothetical protein